MKMKNLVKIIFLLSLVASCKKMPITPIENFTLGGGVLIINEGNFRGGNGSLSFYSYDSSKIYNDIFYSTNGRPLGDVPNSIIVKEDNAYIVVNNSGKIEVIDPSTFESKATITGLISPRNIGIINNNKAYVSSLYSDSVTIIDLSNNSISGYINMRRTSEAIIVAGNKAFISNWAGGKEIMVISTFNDRVVDSIEVGIEPESMVLDKSGMLWVLCNGGWKRDNFAELISINISTDRVSKKYVFPNKQASPSCLKIDALGQTLYYLENGVRAMEVNALKLPPTSLIYEPGTYYNKIGINPGNGDILITDAVDFMQQGYLLIYKNDGTFISKHKAGIIPGSMSFKLRLNSSTN